MFKQGMTVQYFPIKPPVPGATQAAILCAENPDGTWDLIAFHMDPAAKTAVLQPSFKVKQGTLPGQFQQIP